LLDELDEAIRQDQVYVCRDILAHLEPAVSESEFVKRYFEENENKLETLKTDIEKVTDLLKQLNQDDAWTKATEKQGIEVLFQNPKDSPFILTKTVVTFKAQKDELVESFIRLLSFFSEVELMPRWFPDKVLKSNETVHQASKFCKVVEGMIKLPFPVSAIIGPREVIFEGKGYDMSERKALVISCVPVKEGDVLDGGNYIVPAPPPNNIRIEMYGVYYFELVPEGISLKIMQQTDLKSNIIPSALLNWLAKGKAPFDFIKNLRKEMAKYEGSEWEKRVKANPDMYEDIRQRLEATVKNL